MNKNLSFEQRMEILDQQIEAEELAFELYLEDAHVEQGTQIGNPWGK